jgi:dephospho-CoA kinase
MKIRIQRNSVRYRLTRSEVALLKENGYHSEQTAFNGKNFTYAVAAKENITDLQAAFQEDTITLFLPKKESVKWPDSEKVGYENKMVLNDGQILNLLLEKDFVCLDDRIEDQSDNYPNPAAITKK